jgi:tRNA(fMet)-specific endonuclease VapC
MTPEYLFDTTVCIDALRQPVGRVPEGLDRFWSSDIAISVITLAELHVGLFKAERGGLQKARLELLMAHVPVLDFSAAAARHYGEIRAHLEKRGQSIGPLGLLIAAHARSLGATLITSNLKEFKRVPGLKCQNWDR